MPSNLRKKRPLQTQTPATTAGLGSIDAARGGGAGGGEGDRGDLRGALQQAGIAAKRARKARDEDYSKFEEQMAEFL